jgi:hypothetical protein
VIHNNRNQGKRAAWRESTLAARAAGALGAIIVTAGAPALGEIEFSPNIKVGATWTDNIELAPPSQAERTEYVADVVRVLVLTQEISRARSQLD